MKLLYFKAELSWIIVPLFIFLYYYYEKSRSILFYPGLLVSIVGIWNTILVKNLILKYKFGLLQFIFTLLFHLVLLYPIIQYQKYSYPNLFSFLLILLGILILKYLPWWPYIRLTKKFMIYLIIFFYILLNILFFFFINLKFFKIN